MGRFMINGRLQLTKSSSFLHNQDVLCYGLVCDFDCLFTDCMHFMKSVRQFIVRKGLV